MDKIQILHIIKSLGRGGAETLLPETLKIHDRKKFNFHYIYFLPWKNQMESALLENGGEVMCLKANNNIQLILKVREVVRYVRTHKINVIHAHLPWAGIIARMVGRLTGIPIIYTEHNKQERYHVATRIMNLATMNWLTHIVAVSQDVAVSIRKHKPVLKPKVSVILNGVNIQHYVPRKGKSAIRKVLNIPAKSPVIGTVAVFRSQKRLDVWMEIAKNILSYLPDVHFIIVGDGPLKSILLEKRTALGLTERIHLVGLQTEVRPYLNAFDLYMMSSLFEGLPIALLEAMASGCAVISTDAGGVREVVRHEFDGLICSVDKPEYLVDFAVTLLRSREKLEAFGDRARQRIVDSFSLEKMTREIEELYAQIGSET